MQFSLTTLDCHYAIRAYRAVQRTTFRDVNAELLASRETRELLQEDLLLGAAFKKWAVDQGNRRTGCKRILTYLFVRMDRCEL